MLGARSRGAYEGDPFDFVAVYVVPEDVWFIIPEEVVRGQGSVALYPGARQGLGQPQLWATLNTKDGGSPSTKDNGQYLEIVSLSGVATQMLAPSKTMLSGPKGPG